MIDSGIAARLVTGATRDTRAPVTADPARNGGEESRSSADAPVGSPVGYLLGGMERICVEMLFFFALLLVEGETRIF